MAIGFAGTDPTTGFASPDSALKEDVSDLIYQPSPDDTPLYDIMGEKTANSPFHFWLTRTVSNYASQPGMPEGFVYAFTGSEMIQYPDARRSNQTQIFARPIRVSETEAVANHWAIDDVVSDQVNLAVVGIKTDCEVSLHIGAYTTGLSGVARKLQGIFQFLISGITTHTNVTAAVSLSETLFNDAIQISWTFGGHPVDVFAGGYMKRKISGFTGGANTRAILAEDLKLVNSVQLYMSDFNMTCAIHVDRNQLVQAGGQTGYSLLFLDKTVCYKAFLRRWVSERTPKIADSYDAMIKGELTAEWGHPVMHALRQQYL